MTADEKEVNIPGDSVSIPVEPNIYKRIGRALSLLREKKGWKQEYLGSLVSESVFTISRWENGSRKPKIEDLEKLATAFGIEISEFFIEDLETSSSKPIGILNRLSKSGKLTEADNITVLQFALEIVKSKE